MQVLILCKLQLPWSQALKHCQSLDMQLASIESQEEQKNLEKKLLKEGKLLNCFRQIDKYREGHILNRF